MATEMTPWLRERVDKELEDFKHEYGRPATDAQRRAFEQFARDVVARLSRIPSSPDTHKPT